MPELKDASVTIGVPGLNGGGVTTTELNAAVADRAPSSAPFITKTASADLTGETALSSLGTGLLKNTTGTGDLSIATGADVPTHTHTVTIMLPLILDGGGAAIATGVKADMQFVFDATIIQWVVLCDGAITFDVWKDTTANYPPTSGDAITGSEHPSKASSGIIGSTTLTGWTKTINTGDILRFNVDSAAATRATLQLYMTRVIG